MPEISNNRCDNADAVNQMLAVVKDQLFRPDAFQIVPRRENTSFMREYNVMVEDVRNAIDRLGLSDYSHTSCERGKSDAYVFGISEEYYEEGEIYLKITLRDGVLVVSFHPADRKLEHPYRPT